jgi:hypothetical protein
MRVIVRFSAILSGFISVLSNENLRGSADDTGNKPHRTAQQRARFRAVANGIKLPVLCRSGEPSVRAFPAEMSELVTNPIQLTSFVTLAPAYYHDEFPLAVLRGACPAIGYKKNQNNFETDRPR